MKARLMDKLHLLKPVFQMVAAIHHGSTTKYQPNGWEREPFVDVDASALASLDAILRHTLKLCELEDYEEQSGLPHVAHVMCRVQMAITGIIRGDCDTSTNISNLTMDQRKAITGLTLNDLPCVGKYITPEFISTCMQLSVAELSIENSGWRHLEMYSIHRTWLATYFELLMSNLSQQEFCQQLLSKSIQYVLYCSASNQQLLESCLKVFNDQTLETIKTPNWIMKLLGVADNHEVLNLDVNWGTDQVIDQLMQKGICNIS